MALVKKFFEVLEKDLDRAFKYYFDKIKKAETQEERESILNEFIEKYEPQ